MPSGRVGLALRLHPRQRWLLETEPCQGGLPCSKLQAAVASEETTSCGKARSDSPTQVVSLWSGVAFTGHATGALYVLVFM
jgi:hypothetical protein